MPLSEQRVFPGQLAEAYRQERSDLQTSGALARMWAQQGRSGKADVADASAISDSLGWMTILDSMGQESAALADLARQMNAAGLQDIVLLGMGGSSLAPEIFSRLFPGPPRRGRFIVLDSTDPDAILDAERQIDLPRALFIVASKLGRSVETLSLFFYFYNRIQQAGVRPPGSHFLAITNRGSYLDVVARDYHFLRTYRNPPDIPGCYSALTYFGLVPAAVWGVDIAAVLDAAMDMRAACGPEASGETNAALQLGALLAAAAKNGADKLILLCTPKLAPMGNWVEQLVAMSRGKEGRGIVLVTRGTMPAGLNPRECLAIAMTTRCEGDEIVRTAVAELRRNDAAVLEICLSAPAEIGGEFFKWQAATALACETLGIHAFDDAEVQESKENTARALEGFEPAGQARWSTPRLSDNGIEVYAEGKIRSAISTLHVAGALRTFLSCRRPDDYVALLCYLGHDAGTAAELDALRATLSERLHLPVLLAYGPRYLHSAGQIYKGDPGRGMFLTITSHKANDILIPGAKYSFGQLQMAQALGDLDALTRRGKPVIRLHLTQGAPAGLVELRKAVQQALTGLRSTSV